MISLYENKSRDFLGVESYANYPLLCLLIIDVHVCSLCFMLLDI